MPKNDVMDFDMLVRGDIVDSSGMFLEEPMPAQGAEDMMYNRGMGYGFAPPNDVTPGGYPSHLKHSEQPGSMGQYSEPYQAAAGNTNVGVKREAIDAREDTEDKKAKRRKQIAAASRMSRARRKRELNDLRDENERLREERSQFLAKIGELQLKVEALREQGSSDMRVENELLRAQLEEHKRFVACFKRLSEGAPSSLNARHAIYKQGADTAQSHVLGLISQSQADKWSQAIIPADIDMPFQKFSVFYKFKEEYGTEAGKPPRRRLNLRVDVLFSGIDATTLSDFFWDSFSNTSVTQRLYSIKGVEVTPLTDDMPDSNTKMIYYRERRESEKDQDLVLICNRRRRELAQSTLALPGSKDGKDLGKVTAMLMAMSTTQHSAAPEYENANRISSLFVQGAVMWNMAADSRLCIVFSFPDNIHLKAIDGIDDIIKSDGSVTPKFVDIVRSYNHELGDRAS